jgi:hypothetical protein
VAQQSIYFDHLSWLHLPRARQGYDPLAEFRAAERALGVARCAWDLGQRQFACRTAERGLGLAPDHAELLVLRAACSR